MTPERVRSRLSTADLCEWGVYLNSPFSARGREMLMNGWMVHVIRSIVADKKHRPKFSDSLFPFDKLSREFFAESKKPAKAAPTAKGSLVTPGEVMHMAQIHAKAYEKALEDYRAGRTTNKFGLYIRERMRK